MPNKTGHRRFGNVRRLPSGRYQARYLAPDGRMRSHPDTFERKGDAERVLTLIEAQMIHGDWTDPQGAKVRLSEYANDWITQRAGLRPRTADLYRWLLAKQVTPYIGNLPIGKLTAQVIRQWRADLLSRSVSATMAAKACRLLRAVLTTAVEDDKLLPSAVRQRPQASVGSLPGSLSRAGWTHAKPPGDLRAQGGCPARAKSAPWRRATWAWVSRSPWLPPAAPPARTGLIRRRTRGPSRAGACPRA
jgi:hypothetical protein